MMTSNESVIWIFLYCALDVFPLFPLRHVPCFGRLKLPFYKMMLIATVIMLVQSTGFVWLFRQPYASAAVLTLYRQLAMLPFILLTCICARDAWRKTIFVDFLMAPFVLIINFLSILLSSTVFPDFSAANPLAAEVLMRLPILAIACPIKYIFLKRVVRPIMDIQSKQAWSFIWLTPIAFTALSFIQTQFYIISPQPWLLAAVRSLSYGGCVIVSYSLLKTARHVQEYTAMEERFRYTNQLLSLQTDQYSKVLENIETIRAAKHDLRYHLQVISTLTEQKKYEDLSAFLDQYIHSVSLESERMICENLVVNSIAAHMAAKAEKEGIAVTCNFEIENNITFSATDLCIIIGNCMENAIEACGHIPEEKRYITSGARMLGGNFSFVIENSYSGLTVKSGEQFVSLKRSGETIGTGIASVKRVVEKYNGLIEINHEEKTFTVSILLMGTDT